MSFDFSTLVTNRSQEDLEALRSLLATPLADWTAEQLEKFNQAASKGAYNYTDLNRVTACMDYIDEVLTQAGYVTGYKKIFISHINPGPEFPLPDGYTKLEWIQSNKSEYINTEFNPTTETRLVMQISDLSRGASNVVFGSRNPDSPSAANMFGMVLTSSVKNTIRSDYFGNNATITPQSLTEKTTIDKNKNVFTAFEMSVSNSPSSGKTCPDPLYLFCYNSAGSEGHFSSYKLYSCEIYDNGEIQRNFIPAKDANGEPGLYDYVNQKFYTNAGTGNFGSGPEIYEPEPKDDYTWYEDDVPTNAEMTQYLQNVAALQSALELSEGTFLVSEDMVGLTLTEANNIEQLLEEINDYFTALQAVFLRSGMAWVVSGGPEFYFSN